MLRSSALRLHRQCAAQSPCQHAGRRLTLTDRSHYTAPTLRQLHQPRTGVKQQHAPQTTTQPLRHLLHLQRIAAPTLTPPASQPALKLLHTSARPHAAPTQHQPTNVNASSFTASDSAQPTAPSTATSTAPTLPATTPPATSFNSTDPFPLNWSDALNHCISHFPLQTIAVLAALEASSFALSNTFLHQILPTDYKFSTTWIIAYVLSWPIRRSIVVKLTLAPIIALPLANCIPPLKHVDILQLFRNPLLLKLRGQSPAATDSAATTAAANTKVGQSAAAQIQKGQTSLRQSAADLKQQLQDATAKPDAANESATATSSSRISKLLLAIPHLFESFTRNYGIAAFISYRLVGALLMAFIYFLLSYGIDVKRILQFIHYDVDTNVHSKSAMYVVSLLGCALLFPLNIAMLPYVVRFATNPVASRLKGVFVKKAVSSTANGSVKK